MDKELVYFENNGSVLIQLGTFKHCYEDPKRAAEDVLEFRKCGSTEGWEGHMEELEVNHLFNPIGEKNRVSGFSEKEFYSYL